MNLVQLFTTENKALIFILKILVSAIQGFFFYKNANIFFNTKPNKKEKISFILIITLVGLITNLMPNNLILIQDILNVVIILLMLHYNFKLTIYKSALVLVISHFEVFLSGSLSQIILINIFDLSLENILSIPFYNLCMYILSSLFWILMILLSYILKHRKFYYKVSKISLRSCIIINVSLGILTLSLISFLFAKYIDVIPLQLITIIIVALLIYFCISMYSIIRTHTLEKTKADLENEKLYNKTLNLLHDNIRCFKHDFNNIVQAIGGYISVNDMNGLRVYYRSLLDDCKLTNNLNVLDPEIINNPSIYSLLTNKYYVATQKNIKMTFSVFTDLSKINFNIYEFSRMLGILLDNAIEAAEESEEKLIEIEFRSTPIKQLFIIKNTCKDLNISTTKIFEKGYSTKEKNSGIGLWKVHTILSKNTDADLFTSISDNMFSQQLEVFYKTNN